MKLTNQIKPPDDDVILPVDHFEYIADLLKELRVMALNLDADVLAHVIEVAMLEALLQCELESSSTASNG